MSTKRQWETQTFNVLDCSELFFFLRYAMLSKHGSTGRRGVICGLDC